MTESPQAAVNWRGWLVVFALVLVTTVINGTVTAGLPALDRDILTELHISRADLKARESILLLSTGLFGVAIGFLVRSIPARLFPMAGLILLTAALFAYAHAPSIGEIYLLYVLLGAAAACAHVVVIIFLVREHFVALRALATAIALTGMSLGSMVFAGIVVRLSEHFGWRGALNALACIPLAILLPAVPMLLIRSRHASAPADDDLGATRQPPVRAIAPRPLAFLLFATFAVFFASNSMLLNLFLYLQDIGFDARAAAGGISLFFVLGLIAKFATGGAAERWGTYRVWTAQQIVLLLGAVILTVGVPRTVFVGIGLTGIGWAGCFVLTQVVIADFFAGPNLGKFSGAFILFEGISAGSGVWSAGYLYDLLGSYRAAFALNCSLVALAILASRIYLRVSPTRRS